MALSPAYRHGARPPNDSGFRVVLLKYTMINAAKIEMGIATPITRVGPDAAQEDQQNRTASMAPVTSLDAAPSMAALMYTEVSHGNFHHERSPPSSRFSCSIAALHFLYYPDLYCCRFISGGQHDGGDDRCSG